MHLESVLFRTLLVYEFHLYPDLLHENGPVVRQRLVEEDEITFGGMGESMVLPFSVWTWECQPMQCIGVDWPFLLGLSTPYSSYEVFLMLLLSAY